MTMVIAASPTLWESLDGMCLSGLARFSTQDVNLHIETYQLVWVQQELPGGVSRAVRGAAATTQVHNYEGGLEFNHSVWSSSTVPN